MGEYSAVEDLSIEQNDSFMAIDAYNKSKDFMAILFFILMILAAGISGIFAPKQRILHGFPQLIESGNTKRLQLNVTRITPANMYYKSYLMMNYFPSQKREIINLDVNVRYDCYEKRNISWSNSKRFYQTWKFNENEKPQNFLRLNIESTRFTECEEMRYDVNYSKQDKTFASALMIEQGNNAYYAYMSSVKLLFFLSITLINFWFDKKIPKTSESSIAPQQKFTRYLLKIAMICIFPTNILTLLFLRTFSLLIDILAFNFLLASIALFSLYIIDDLQYQNAKIYKSFFKFKLCYAIIYFLVGTLQSLTVPYNFRFNIGSVYVFVHMILIIWLIYIIIKVYGRVSGDEYYKIRIYAFVCIFVELIILSNGLNFLNKKFIESSAMPQMLINAAVVFYVNIMTFFHWPFDNSRDREYTDNNMKNDMVEDFADDLMIRSDDSDPFAKQENLSDPSGEFDSQLEAIPDENK